MEKEYNYTPEDPKNHELREPAIKYNTITQQDDILPFPTENELKECITGDELLEYMYDHIHKLFNEK